MDQEKRGWPTLELCEETQASWVAKHPCFSLNCWVRVGIVSFLFYPELEFSINVGMKVGQKDGVREGVG